MVNDLLLHAHSMSLKDSTGHPNSSKLHLWQQETGHPNNTVVESRWLMTTSTVETKTISFCSCEAAGVFTPLWCLKPFWATCFSRCSAAISVLRTAIIVGEEEYWNIICCEKLCACTKEDTPNIKRLKKQSHSASPISYLQCSDAYTSTTASKQASKHTHRKFRNAFIVWLCLKELLTAPVLGNNGVEGKVVLCTASLSTEQSGLQKGSLAHYTVPSNTVS